MPAYMISHVTVTDKEKFDRYFEKTRKVGAQFGVKPLAIGVQPKMLNGSGDGHQMVVIAEFESQDVLDAWYNSEDYQALVPLREAGSIQQMVAYEAKPFPQA